MSLPLLPTAARHALLPILLALSFFVAGCGGGGGGGSTPPPVVNDLAPASIASRSLIFTDPDQPTVKITYAFSTSTYTSPSGDSGSYTYSKTSGTTNQAQLQVASTFNPARTYKLTFTSSAGGTYVDQVGKSSTFALQ